MLRQLDNSIWVNEVPFKMIGINFGNRMTCIQLPDNNFWLHSPTRFDSEIHQKIMDLGNIKFLVTPSIMHNLFVMDWKKQNDNYQVLAPSKAKKVQADIALDHSTTEQLNELFKDEITCIPIHGMPMLQEYAFIHHASKTLILTDLAFNFGNQDSGWSKFFLKVYGAYNKFGPTITIRALIKDKLAFSESLQNINSQDFDRIIVSHGNVVESDGKNIFNNAFKQYLTQNRKVSVD